MKSIFNRRDFPNDKLTEPVLRQVMAYYYATISQIDHHVGRMTRLLKRKGIYDDTLIVFTADHGDFMGFHHMLLKANYMYDPVVKVPLIIKWPRSKRAGTVSQQMVNNIDMAPTFCKAAGCVPDPGMRGHILQNESNGHDLIFAESNGGRQVMARSRDYKLILVDSRNENLFFDLRNDPSELNNLYKAPRYHDQVKTMEAALSAWRCKDAKPQGYQDHDAPQIDQPNVPSHDLSQREAIIEYYRKKMFTLQGRT